MAEDYQSQYAYTRIYGWIELPDIAAGKRIDIVSMNCNFPINGIPSASCMLSVGTDPRSNSLALIHEIAGKLERRTKISIMLQLEGEEIPGQQWPSQEFKVFDGYVSGSGTAMFQGSTTLTISAEHWLSDLRASSKFSAYASPLSSNDLISRATAADSVFDTLKFGGARTTWFENAISDLWGSGIKEGFKILADQDRINSDALIDNGISDPELLKNYKALSAIERFDQKIETAKLSIDGGESKIKDWITDNLGKLLDDPTSGADMWTTLLTMASIFKFSVIPNVEGATCAPHVKQLKETYATIKANEYSVTQLSGRNPIVLRALGLYGMGSSGILDSSGTIASPTKNFLGYYDLAINNQGIKDIVQGQFLTIPAPPWITGGAFSEVCKHTLPIGGNRIPTKANPKKADGKPPETPNEQTEAVYKLKLGDKLAHAMFLDMALESRRGSVMSRLRFDIGPGSSIALETVGKDAELPFYRGDKLYANVDGVSISIDAWAAKAGTSFKLSNLRTDKEQQEINGLALDSNPLYTEKWIGTYLVEGFTPANTE
jgi:hypothetical protein